MRLKEARKTRKLTQQQVADLLGVPLRTYQNYEREVNDPDTDVLCRLADYYGMTTDYLIGYSDIAVSYDSSRVLNRSDDEMRLVLSYRKLPRSLRQSVLDIVEALCNASGDLRDDTH